MLLDFDDAESQVFMYTFNEPISNFLHSCLVHFICSAMHVTSLANSLNISPVYHIFISIVKHIPDKSSKDVVQDALEVLSGAKRFEVLSHPNYHQWQLIK